MKLKSILIISFWLLHPPKTLKTEIKLPTHKSRGYIEIIVPK